MTMLETFFTASEPYRAVAFGKSKNPVKFCRKMINSLPPRVSHLAQYFGDAVKPRPAMSLEVRHKFPKNVPELPPFRASSHEIVFLFKPPV